MEGGEVSPTDTEHGHREGRGQEGTGGDGRRWEETGGDRRKWEGMGGDGRDGRDGKSLYAENTVECGSSFV